MSNTIERFTEPFPKQLIKQRRGPGGVMLDYIECAEVITRLNEVTNGNWSSSHGDPKKYGENTVVVACQIVVDIDGTKIAHQDFGTASMREGQDVGDSIKAAASDGIKRCARKFGIGLHLYRS